MSEDQACDAADAVPAGDAVPPDGAGFAPVVVAPGGDTAVAAGPAAVVPAWPPALRRWGRRAVALALIGALTWVWLARIGVWTGTVYVCLIEALVLFMVALGWLIMGTPAGVLVNARNCVSLAKLQIAAWTVIVIAALASGAIWNAWWGVAQPLAINIPDPVLEALGISAASFVAAPAVLSLKGQGTASPADVAAATPPVTAATPDPADALSVGSLFARGAPAAAQWSDIVRGDDLATARQIDLGKVQQLLITLLLIVIYSVAVWNALIKVHTGYGALAALPVPVPPGAGAAAVAQAHAAVAHGQTLLAQCRASGFFTGDGKAVDPVCAPAVFAGLPEMDAKFVWLLAISHAGYIGSKALTNTAPGQTADAGGA